MSFHVPQDCGLDPAVGKIHAAVIIGMAVLGIAVTVLDLCERKLHRLGISVRREKIDDRPAGISKLQKLGDLVESLAGSVIPRMSHIVVHPAVLLALREKKMG